MRAEVREFLAAERAAGTFETHVDTWLSGVDPAFSKKLGDRGWLGMTWPKQYGGHERSAMERYAVTEELLAAGRRWPRTGSPTASPGRTCCATAPRSSARRSCRASPRASASSSSG